MMDRERGQGVHGMVVWFLVSSGQVIMKRACGTFTFDIEGALTMLEFIINY